MMPSIYIFTHILTPKSNHKIENNNNKTIFKAQNLVHWDYSKHIYVHACACAHACTHTHTYAHEHSDCTELNLHSLK